MKIIIGIVIGLVLGGVISIGSMFCAYKDITKENKNEE